MQKMKKEKTPRQKTRAQTALEYLLIISGAIFLVLLVVLAVKAVIDQGWISIQPSLETYNQTVANATK